MGVFNMTDYHNYRHNTAMEHEVKGLEQAEDGESSAEEHLETLDVMESLKN